MVQIRLKNPSKTNVRRSFLSCTKMLNAHLEILCLGARNSQSHVGGHQGAVILGAQVADHFSSHP